MASDDHSKGHKAGEHDSVQAFLSQPAYHADEDAPRDEDADRQSNRPPMRLGATLRRFFFEKPVGRYSSIAPRTPDGRRTKIFPFNGNGWGR
jgi:hypothetical protein